MKVFFHNDLDGRCSGAIVHLFHKNYEDDGTGFEYIEIDYKDRFPLEIIKPNEAVWIVDFSLKPEVMEELFKITSRIIWIDHHKTNNYQYSREVAGLRIIEDKKYAACELTWMFCFPGELLPRAVELIGDRDKWALQYGEETANFNQGLKLYPNHPKHPFWNGLFNDPSMVKAIIKEGEICVQFRDSFCYDYAQSYGWETEFEGYKCFALGLYMFGSEAFGLKIKEYDICLSYEFLGDKWIVGLYSEKVDVGLIAKKYGGGGHKGAAGFVIDILPFYKGNKKKCEVCGYGSLSSLIKFCPECGRDLR